MRQRQCPTGAGMMSMVARRGTGKSTRSRLELMMKFGTSKNTKDFSIARTMALKSRGNTR